MDCCICLEDIEIHSYISIIPCGHLFHALCYNNYKGYVCPICRTANMRNKVDTIMVNKKPLYDWSKDDFNTYIEVLDSSKELINFKKNEMIEQMELQKRSDISKHIKFLYDKNLSHIRYNILKNITDCSKNFTILYIKFGEMHVEYPLVFLIKGPVKQKNYFKSKNIKSFLDYLMEDFPMFNFKIKPNRNIMCYEIKAQIIF